MNLLCRNEFEITNYWVKMIVCARIHTCICMYIYMYVHVHVCMHGNQSCVNPAISSTSFYFFFSFQYSDLHIGSPEHSPCLLRRVFHQSSLLCHLLILSSIALECNKFCGKLSNDVLTFIVLFIFEFCDVSVAFLLFFDLVVLPKISTYG